MISNLRFRLWLLIGSILVVLLCRGFKGSPSKTAVDPKALETKGSPPIECQNGSPPDSP